MQSHKKLASIKNCIESADAKLLNHPSAGNNLASLDLEINLKCTFKDVIIIRDGKNNNITLDEQTWIYHFGFIIVLFKDIALGNGNHISDQRSYATPKNTTSRTVCLTLVASDTNNSRSDDFASYFSRNIMKRSIFLYLLIGCCKIFPLM